MGEKEWDKKQFSFNDFICMIGGLLFAAAMGYALYFSGQ